MNHVELVGVAGAGKSTIGRRIRERNPEIHSLIELHDQVVSELLLPGELAQLGSKVPPKILSHTARIAGLSDRGVNYCSLKYPQLLFKTAKYIDKYTDDDERLEYISTATMDLIEKFGMIDEHCQGSPTLLIDEGFAAKTGSILHPPQHSQPFSHDDLRDYISVVPLPDVIVFVRASPETCVRRLEARESGPPHSWNSLDPDSYVEFASDAQATAEYIVRTFESLGTEIIEVDTDGRSVDQSTVDAEQLLSVVTPQ